MLKMLEIISALVVKSRTSPDRVFLRTGHPSPYIEEYMSNKENLQVAFSCTANTGEQYVLDNFNIQPEVVQLWDLTLRILYPFVLQGI